jgi:hypothetical protein
MTKSIRYVPTHDKNSILLDIRYGRPELLAAAMLRLSAATLANNQEKSKPVKPREMKAHILTVLIVKIIRVK